MTGKEKEWGVKASQFIKAELKRAKVGYKELAERLNKRGLRETETSITGKLGRGAFAASFFLRLPGRIGTERNKGGGYLTFGSPISSAPRIASSDMRSTFCFRRRYDSSASCSAWFSPIEKAQMRERWA